MNMRPGFVATAAACMLMGCLVPVNVAGDGGEDGGEGGDGGGGAPCTGIQAAVSPRPAGAVMVWLEGCDERPLVVSGPDGVPVDAGITSDASATHISHPNLPPGLYTATVGAGSTAQLIYFELYEQQPLDAGTVRTYVDRVDTCESVALTNEGRLVCQRPGAQVTVYETDGGLHSSFAGADVAVAGNEVWSRGGGGIERRVDGPAGLALEGSLVDPLLRDWAAFGETSPGRSIRGGEYELVEFTWDAGAISSRRWWIFTQRRFVFREGETIWDQFLATLQPGCQTMFCGNVEAYPFGVRSVIGFDATRVWVVERDASLDQWPNANTQLAELRRPLDPAQPLRFRHIPFTVQRPRWPNERFEMPVFGEPSAVILVEGPGGTTYFRLMSEHVLSNTSRGVLSSLDPKTVRFTPAR